MSNELKEVRNFIRSNLSTLNYEQEKNKVTLIELKKVVEDRAKIIKNYETVLEDLLK